MNPLVGVAQWLERLGHHVGWLTLPEPAPQLDALGIEAVVPHGLPESPPFVTGDEAFAQLVLDTDALGRWIHTLLLDTVPGQIEPLRRAIVSFAPDVIALDGMLYQAVIAAHLQGIPYAGISSALTLLEPPEVDSELMRTLRALADERTALFARYGLEPDFRTCECLSPRLNVIFATRAFVGDASVPPHTLLVGPSQPVGVRGDEVEFSWAPVPTDRPIVYASFGSQIYWQPEHLTTIAKVADALGATLIASAGSLAKTPFADTLPGHAILCEYVPQLAVLERAAALVTHGGANSIMESLRHGVPQLVIPICNDQPVQAFFVERSGTGIAVSPDAFDEERCRSALVPLLDEAGSHRAQAQRVATDYAAHDGARKTAEHIAALA